MRSISTKTDSENSLVNTSSAPGGRTNLLMGTAPEDAQGPSRTPTWPTPRWACRRDFAPPLELTAVPGCGSRDRDRPHRDSLADAMPGGVRSRGGHSPPGSPWPSGVLVSVASEGVLYGGIDSPLRHGRFGVVLVTHRVGLLDFEDREELRQTAGSSLASLAHDHGHLPGALVNLPEQGGRVYVQLPHNGLLRGPRAFGVDQRPLGLVQRSRLGVAPQGVACALPRLGHNPQSIGRD